MTRALEGQGKELEALAPERGSELWRMQGELGRGPVGSGEGVWSGSCAVAKARCLLSPRTTSRLCHWVFAKFQYSDRNLRENKNTRLHKALYQCP